jgi:glycosyltransferase involved in cell wall biosynthesis
MKLVSLSLVRNEEHWIWYALTSVWPHVDEILVFDNHSTDATVEIVRGMEHVRDKVTLHERFGGASEQETRERTLAIARERGATHVLFLDGDEVHVDHCLGLAVELLRAHEHRPPLHDPPHNPHRPGDHEPTEGILVKNIGMKPIHPGFAGPDTCRPRDRAQPDTDHGCYNFAVRIAALDGLRGNGQEWGRHGFLEPDGVYLQSSPRTLWLPGAFYFHFSLHPRSSVALSGYRRQPRDEGSVTLPDGVHVPAVLYRPDGPGNPTLQRWGAFYPPLSASSSRSTGTPLSSAT